MHGTSGLKPLAGACRQGGRGFRKGVENERSGALGLPPR